MAKLIKFYQKNIRERKDHLISKGDITSQDADLLHESTSDQIHNVNNELVENVVGAMPLPFAVIEDMPLANKLYTVPLVTEETSVVAALNKSASYVRNFGGIDAFVVNGTFVLGQIIFFSLTDREKENFENDVLSIKDDLIDYCNKTVCSSMYARKGGVKSLAIRKIKGNDKYRLIKTKSNREDMYVIDVKVDTVDAMGANCVNQVCTCLSSKLKEYKSYKADTVILSNYNLDQNVTVKMSVSGLSNDVAEKIVSLTAFARADIYRGVTHNKGILNGIDAVLLATGNDWRAAEAAIHSYASKSGVYQPLSDWEFSGGILQGEMSLPVPCGIVGGVLNIHPVAKLALNILGVKSKVELMKVIASVGLLQNFAALRSLCDQGIILGHMRLHISNLILSVTKDSKYVPLLKKRCENILNKKGVIGVKDVKMCFEEYKKELII